MSDFNKAAELDPDNGEYDIDRANLSFDAGEYMRSLDYIDLFLLRHEGTLQAYLIKARSLRSMEQYTQAVKYYELALTKAASMDSNQSPEWYVEYADTLSKAGEKEKALKVLKQGISQLGEISVFQVNAAALEVELELYDAALHRIDQLLSKSQRKDIWLARRAEILSTAGRDTEARQTYRQAYAALQSLPPRLQNLPVSRELENTLVAHIPAE